MENSPDLDLWEILSASLEAGFGEASYADGVVGLQEIESLPKQLVAGFFQGAAQGGGEFVGGQILGSFGQEAKRAVVGDEGMVEEPIGSPETIGKESPKSFSRYLLLGACGPHHRAFGMESLGCLRLGGDLEPIADGGDFTEGNAGLHHSPGARVHSKKQQPDITSCITFDVFLVGGPGILQRVVDPGADRGKIELLEALGEPLGGIEQAGGGIGDGTAVPHATSGHRLLSFLLEDEDGIGEIVV